MQAYWWWWGVAVLLGLFEMLTPTFYLLVLGVGFAGAGFVAWASGGLAWQLLAAAAVSILAWLALRRFSPKRGRVAAHSNRDLLLDIGERVRVERWQPDRRAQVIYRGTAWTAELDPGDPGPARPGEHVIRRIEGSRLIVARTDAAVAPLDARADSGSG